MSISNWPRSALKYADVLALAILILLSLWIGWNRTWYVGRINWADDFIWGSRWDRVLAGQLPYRNFFELYGPGFPVLLAPLYNALGQGLPAVRFIHFVIFPTISLLVMFALLGLLGLKGWTKTIALLWLAFLFRGMPWLDQPTRIWFGLAAFLPTWFSFKTGKPFWALIGGITTIFVGALSTEQGTFVAIASSLGLLVNLFLHQDQPSLKFFIAYLTGLTGAIICFISWLAAAQMLTPYLGIAFGYSPTLQNAAYGFIFPGFDLVDHPSRIVWYLPFMGIILAAAIIFLKWNELKKIGLFLVMLLTYAVFSLRIYIGRTEIGHFTKDNVALWIIFISLWFTLLKETKHRLAATFFESLATIGLTWIIVGALGPYWSTLLKEGLIPGSWNGKLVYFPPAKVWLYPQEAQDIGDVLTFVNQNIPRSDAIYPFAVISGFSSLLGRVTPNYFEQDWFAQTSDQQKRLVEEVERRKIPWVIYSFTDDVIRFDQMSNLYLVNTYLPVAHYGDYAIMKRARDWQPNELSDFLAVGKRVNLSDLVILQDAKQLNGNSWQITGSHPTWKAPVVGEASLVIFRYRLGFLPGLASLSKTALAIIWSGGSRIYQEPFLLPGGWQEAWVELPAKTTFDQLTFSLSWPGGLNPHASTIDIDQIRLR